MALKEFPNSTQPPRDQADKGGESGSSAAATKGTVMNFSNPNAPRPLFRSALNSLLGTALLGLGLGACAGQGLEADHGGDASQSGAPQSGELARLDIEIIGEGQVMIVEPYVESCTSAEGVCSYYFERGTQVQLEGSFLIVDEEGREKALECAGRAMCVVEVDGNVNLRADFEFPIVIDAAKELAGTEHPSVIVDPALGQSSSRRARALGDQRGVSAF